MVTLIAFNARSVYHFHPVIMWSFIKREAVFSIAFVAAFLSAFFNPPSLSWIEAIDFRTLALLFSLMGVSEGLKESGLFDSAGGMLIRKAGNTRLLSFSLLLIVFISSMFFTNDVSLLMFVPFTIMLFDKENIEEKYVIRLVVLETIAANLGSMTTPVGNPQNLYICSYFDVGAGPFFRTILPYSLLSALLIAICFVLFLSSKRDVSSEEREIRTMDRAKTIVYLAFLLIALLSVFRVINWPVLFIVEFLFLLIADRKILKRIDYILLFTFVCFFIFSENIRNIDAVRNLIEKPMAEHPIAVSALVSQIISNVPAAILLSPFSVDFKGVLIGTDIGGLGTPVASLASLISMKIYFGRQKSQKGRYMAVFIAMNFMLLILLALFAWITE